MSGETYAVSVPKGYRVGRWEVREPLASGAFATVYAGRPVGDGAGYGGADAADGSVESGYGDGGAGDDALPRRVALKFLPTGTRTPRQLRHLRELADREVELLGRLRSPRLIRMYDTLTVDDPEHPELDGATVLVLERAEASLDAVAEPLPDPGAVLAQICEGLAQLHRAGWVHGDLKPANVLLMKDGSVRLADFNMAAEMQGTHAYAPAFATPDYTPPELLWPEMDERGARIRPSADVWAFGVLAHVVLTGDFPLPGSTTEARCDAAMRYARGAAELRLSPQLPDGWAGIIRDCLARTHGARVSREGLLRRVEEVAGTGRSPRLPRLRPRFRRRHPVLAGALASLLLVVSGLGVVAGIAHHWATSYDGTPVYDAVPVPSPSSYGYGRCPQDSVCFFSEHHGNGEMCSWRGSDSDWQSGDETCAWAAHHPVRSVFNNVSGSRDLDGVVYYRGSDYSPAGYDRRRTAQRTGCTGVNQQGNLAGTYAPRSHRLVRSCTYSLSLWGLLSSVF